MIFESELPTEANLRAEYPYFGGFSLTLINCDIEKVEHHPTDDDQVIVIESFRYLREEPRTYRWLILSKTTKQLIYRSTILYSLSSAELQHNLWKQQQLKNGTHLRKRCMTKF